MEGKIWKSMIELFFFVKITINIGSIIILILAKNISKLENVIEKNKEKISMILL